jgi:hypothetical protein
LSPGFDEQYAASGRLSIASEYILRALLFQVFYSIRSERLLVEQIDYNLFFRWFVGLGTDDAVWNHAVFSKNPRITTCGRIVNALAQWFLLRRFMTDARNQNETCIISARPFAVRGGGAVDIRQGIAHLLNTWSDALAEPALAATPHRRLRM